LSLRNIHFSLKDASLREDVGVLGVLVGEIIEEQAGEDVLALVEAARRAAIRSRQDDPEAAAELASILSEVTDVSSFVRAFSVYFQVVNLAERVHRIRRRRDYDQSSDQPQPGGIEAALKLLAASGVGVDDLQALLDRMLLEPVFTAHPTEATRRTILQKHLRIVRMLVGRLDPSLSPRESRRLLNRIRGEVTALWQTEEQPESKRTVSDESEHVLFYLTEILYRIVPPFYEELRDAARRTYGDEAARLQIPPFLRFGSWVGGDMDGNPNVGAESILETVRKHKATLCSLYKRDLDGLYQQLTQSGPHSSVNADIYERIASYASQFPDAADSFPARHANMPYRRLLHLLREKIDATQRNKDHGYLDAAEFLADLERIQESLRANKGDHAGLFLVERLITRALTFEFHLASLDLRQDSQSHRIAIGQALDDDTWTERTAADRTTVLLELLESKSPADLSRIPETLHPLHAVAEARGEGGPRSTGLYIVSMTQGVDDILSVLALAHWSGLPEHALDVTPLFETVDDLRAAPDILDALFSIPLYRDHVTARGDHQVAMIGYSDSGKDGGIAAARLGLHQAQTRIAAVAKKHDIALTLFHGRGGTISRGGGRIDRAVEASPSAYRSGRLRLTEQGEVINQRYGVRDIAERTAEQMFAPTILAAANVLSDTHKPEWDQVAATIARKSREAYRALVYETPDFFDYFRAATPIDVIERMQIGSRPVSRRAGRGIEDMRAIPWVFAWTQSRHQITGWYGIGTGLESASAEHGEKVVIEAIESWPFLTALISDVESALASADLDIAACYAQLTGTPDHPIYRRIRDEYDTTLDQVLRLKGTDTLLEEDELLRRSIELRNPYIDPLSHLQVHLLSEWRLAGRPDGDDLRILVSTVNGIAQGVQNTG